MLIESLDTHRGYNTMGLYKQYFRITQYTRNQLFGISNNAGTTTTGHIPIPMLISQQFSNSRVIVIMMGIFTLALGIILSSIPWLDYIILKNLKLSNGSLSFQYWQRPGVIRLTKVYIFNVTNPDSFLNLGEKPKLQEIGPFVYREDMEKVNIKFHDNGTITYQHKKILEFVPELSVNKDLKITVPNISLLTLAGYSNSLGKVLQTGISFLLNFGRFKPFVTVTVDELAFGYDDKLVKLAHQFYPKWKRPMDKMGLLINRNGTLPEVHNIYTGETGMHEFGLIEKLNGKTTLPFWENSPCNTLRASEGSFFPPRYFTNKDIVHIYDKDLCRIMPLKYRGPVTKHGISADLFTPTDDMFETVNNNPDNKCYCPGNEYCPPKGLQNIGPCHFDAPVYLSFPHFYQADPKLLDLYDGLKPQKEKHESYFKIQPKIGVPIEGKVRAQLNLRISEAPYIRAVQNFPSMIFPIMWVEEGIDDVTPPIRRWLYLATTFADIACPLMTYGFIFLGSCILIGVFINTYKSLMFTKQTIEIGMKSFRKKNITHASRFISRHDSYTLLDLTEGEFI